MKKTFKNCRALETTLSTKRGFKSFNRNLSGFPDQPFSFLIIWFGIITIHLFIFKLGCLFLQFLLFEQEVQVSVLSQVHWGVMWFIRDENVIQTNARLQVQIGRKGSRCCYLIAGSFSCFDKQALKKWGEGKLSHIQLFLCVPWWNEKRRVVHHERIKSQTGWHAVQ